MDLRTYSAKLPMPYGIMKKLYESIKALNQTSLMLLKKAKAFLLMQKYIEIKKLFKKLFKGLFS